MHVSYLRVHTILLLLEPGVFPLLAVGTREFVTEGFTVFGVDEIVGHGLVGKFVEEGCHDVVAAFCDEEDGSGTRG